MSARLLLISTRSLCQTVPSCSSGSKVHPNLLYKITRRELHKSPRNEIKRRIVENHYGRRKNSSRVASTSPPTSSVAEPVSPTANSSTTPVAETVPKPTARQLLMHALTSAVPMIGFGFMDNTIMIHAGHYVDCTLGVTFGLSTLAAAGIGQIFSGIGGVVFGDALEELFHRIAPGDSIKMTKAQRNLRLSRFIGLLGGVVGVTLGCALGLVNLFFVDEYKASLLKLHALEEGQEFEFEVEVDNEVNPGYTTVIVRGPDVDGVLASITASIASCGCSVAELHAGYRKVLSSEDEVLISDTKEGGASSGEDAHGNSVSSMAAESIASMLNPAPPRVEDIFLIKDRSTQQALDNDELEALGQEILAAAKDPLNSHSLKNRLEELQFENDALAERVLMLEKALESRQIKVVRSQERVEGGDHNE